MSTLGSLCAPGGIQTGPFGSQLHAEEYSLDGVPVVMPQDIGENQISVGSIARVPDSTAQRLERHRLVAGDIVYSRRGDVGRRSWVSDEQEGWLCGTGCLRVRVDPSLADSRFISYALGSPESRAWIVAHAVGATMLNLNTGILAAVPVATPPLPTQRAIAEVLGALDDKIAANTRVAALSEDVLSTEFAALQRSPGGQVVAASDLVEFNPRSAMPTKPEPVYVDMQKLPTSGSQISGWSARPARGGARFVNGDTLMARITPCLENRKVGFVDFLDAGESALGSTEFVVMRSRPGFARPLSFLLAIDEGFRAHAIQHMVGSSGRQRVSAGDLASYELCLPLQSEELDALGVRSEAMFALLATLRDESRHLAELRDTLLPHLMSGRLTVREAEKHVEEVL